MRDGETIGSQAVGAPVRIKHVALIMDHAMSPRRRLIRGVARYVQEHEPWAIYLTPAGVEKSLTNWLRNWNGDGAIVSFQDQNAVTGNTNFDTFAVPKPVNGRPFQLPYVGDTLPLIIPGPHVARTSVPNNPLTAETRIGRSSGASGSSRRSPQQGSRAACTARRSLCRGRVGRRRGSGSNTT